MSRKKIDKRIPTLIENGVTLGHRTLFLITGEKSKDQVVILHHLLSKSTVRARPTVLWCYKKELGFTSNRKKRMKQIQKKKNLGQLDVNESDQFELFVASTDIRYCYYNETHKVLGNTFGMCVLQDFEAITPNLLARTIETVEGGGVILILLNNIESKKQFFTMAMDVHARFRSEANNDVVGRFNERFLLSLVSCDRCLLLDDNLTVLPFSSYSLSVNPVKKNSTELSSSEAELKELKESLVDTQPVGVLVNACKTLDQAKALLKFIDVIADKTLRATVALTAARGRGKSAALGLSMAGAVAFGYSNIFVTSPSPENLKTLFDFIFKGFDVLGYEEHVDYDVIQSTNPEFRKSVVRVNVTRDHRQTIQFIHPSDAAKLSHAELVVIDEAAAIPLPLVKSMMGPHLVFMASTINGYEGTGRSLSLKLIQQLRKQSTLPALASKPTSTDSATNRSLHEIQLKESIRYKDGDSVEKWLNSLLCLDATLINPTLTYGCPLPEDCELYYINRDTLFSYCKASEVFLQRLMSLYVASHYKNSPNDLQMMSDAPAHHLFCLVGPVNPNQVTLPEVLCVVQVCLEGKIAKETVMNSLSRGKRAAGDLIPWTISQQFQDNDFPSLSGARIIRISTHPEYQKMGYGTRALKLLQDYYEGRMIGLEDEPQEIEEIDRINDVDESLSEQLTPRKKLPPLLLKLTERRAEKLQYLGVSYGITAELLRFWKKSGYVPVYLRQTKNDLTGEHSCIMLKCIESDDDSTWLTEFWKDFRRRFVNLLGYEFRLLTTSVALSVVVNSKFADDKKEMAASEIDAFLTSYDLKRLELYSQNLADYHLIMDLLPVIAKLYFSGKLGEIQLSAVQSAILLGIGLQYKSVDDLSTELDLPASQLLALFNRFIRKIVKHLNFIKEEDVDSKMTQEMNEKIEEKKQTEKSLSNVKSPNFLNIKNLDQYAIKGSDDDWANALASGGGDLISVKGKAEKRKFVETKKQDEEPDTHKNKKQKSKNKFKKKK